jgi:hypothetical protein
MASVHTICVLLSLCLLVSANSAQLSGVVPSDNTGMWPYSNTGQVCPEKGCRFGAHIVIHRLIIEGPRVCMNPHSELYRKLMDFENSSLRVDESAWRAGA